MLEFVKFLSGALKSRCHSDGVDRELFHPTELLVILLLLFEAHAR